MQAAAAGAWPATASTWYLWDMRGAMAVTTWLAAAVALAQTAPAAPPPTPENTASRTSEVFSVLGTRGVPARLRDDPLGVFTGLPDNVRYQTWGFILTVQNVPILEPGYWDRAIGDAYQLNRSTREKVRQLPGVLRMVFYDYYMGQVRNFTVETNPDTSYRPPALHSAWSRTWLSLPNADGEGFTNNVAGSLSSRFSPEEVVDLGFFLVATSIPTHFTRDEWLHTQHLLFYNSAWLGAAFFGYQLAQNNAQLRGGRWFRFKDYSLGAFATVRRLGVRWQPNYGVDVRFSVPGAEAAFSVSGRIGTAPDTENMGFDASIRVNWLNYFARSAGWDVNAEAGAHYTAWNTTPARNRTVAAGGRVSGRRENILDMEGLTVGLDTGARTDFATSASADGSVKLEHLPADAAVGLRVGGTVSLDRPSDVNVAFFVAAPLRPPGERPAERAYQLRARLMREQIAVVRRTAAGPLRPGALDDEKRLLRARAEDAYDAREQWRQTLRGRAKPPDGYVTDADLDAVRALAGSHEEGEEEQP